MSCRPPHVCAALLLAACVASAALAESSDTIQTYLERYHRLTPSDVRGRIDLADYCRSHELYQQQCDLLAEAVKLQPDRDDLHKALLAADANRFRAIDPAWARKVESLMGPGYRLQHSSHFSLLTDMDPRNGQVMLDSLESSYRQIYAESAAIGLRPLPPRRPAPEHPLQQIRRLPRLPPPLRKRRRAVVRRPLLLAHQPLRLLPRPR